MKLSLNWLKDYVDPKLSTDELVHRLTMAGLEVEEVYNVGKDVVLDLEITPNRPDCLNTFGLAREISAITAKDLKAPKVKSYKPTRSNEFSIAIEDKKDCGRYIGTLINAVNIFDAPLWVQERINATGIKSVNNAVDITNFVLMELGQPLHAFDFDKIVGGKITVRRAKSGEKIITLDGIERKLDPSILVIVDTKSPVAIAGIMGGQGSEITSTTKNILLESAQFDMGLVRRASCTLGLKSDSSYRFERGVDLEGVLNGANRATDLLLEITKGKFSGRMDAGASKSIKHKAIEITVNDIENLLGTRVSSPQVKNALVRLGLKVAAGKKGGFKVTPLSFRGDLKQQVDLIEEIARVIGYDHLDVSFPHIQVANIVPNSRPREIKKIISDTLIAQGYSEAITFSLISQKDLDKSGLSNLKALALHNALSNEHNLLRPSMLPSMLKVALTNFNHGQKELRLFELGKRYFTDGEKYTLAILATGRKPHDWRNNSKESINFYDVKGVLEQMYCRLGVQGAFDSSCITKIERNVLQQWDIKAADVYFTEIDLQPIFKTSKPTIKYEPLVEFPAIHRDVSVALKNDVSYGEIEKLSRKLGGQILKSVVLIEEYTGDKIQKGHRGLVFSLVYQAQDRTLREEEVNSIHYNILKALTSQFGAIQR